MSPADSEPYGQELGSFASQIDVRLAANVRPRRRDVDALGVKLRPKHGDRVGVLSPQTLGAGRIDAVRSSVRDALPEALPFSLPSATSPFRPLRRLRASCMPAAPWLSA